VGKNFDGLRETLTETMFKAGTTRRVSDGAGAIAQYPEFDKEARETLLDVFRDAADYWAEKKCHSGCSTRSSSPSSPYASWRAAATAAPAALQHILPLSGPVPVDKVQCRAMKNIVILISGRGSNMEAIVRALAAERLAGPYCRRHQQPCRCPGLALPPSTGSPRLWWPIRITPAAPSSTPPCRRDRRLCARSGVLAGFMRILTSRSSTLRGAHAQYPPVAAAAVPGPGDARAGAGRRRAGTWRDRAFRHGRTRSRADGGAGAVPVLPDDTVETLSARVLEQEHVIYPRAVRWL
jgi:phosphoribosylglycinamide formyltransferase-1